MPMQLCYCSRKTLKVQDATHVFNGIPCCNRACFLEACRKERQKIFDRREADLRAREEAARMME